MISNITFSDKDGKSILDFSSKLPEKGTYKVAEPMRSYFENKLVNAQWILAIFDKSTDQNQGKLLDRNSGEWGAPPERPWVEKFQALLDLLFCVFDEDGDGVDLEDLFYWKPKN